MLMPMSWLAPPVVHRAAFPLTYASQLPPGGVNVTVRLAGSMSFHVLPSLPVSGYWVVLDLLTRVVGLTGTRKAVIRVGEKLPPMGPAPAQIVYGSGWFAFHCSFAVYAIDAATGMT